jgi:DNA-binding LacI/PurR family transcriptional regulator
MATDRERVTLQTIADKLEVSRTTVSNAYGRPDQLNPALRQRILDVAQELGYAGPHAAARTLRRGRSGSLGVVLSSSLTYAFRDPVSLAILKGVAEASEPSGTAILLLPVPSTADAGCSAIRDAVVDAFLVYTVDKRDARLSALLERGLPTAFVDEPRRDDAAFVGIDDRAAARTAAEHLLALGHRRFGIVTFPLVVDRRSGPADLARQAATTIGISRERLAGYADALVAAGLAWEEVPVHEVSANSTNRAADAADALLDLGPRPTAILAFSDVLALGVLRAAAARGVRVPEDLSVVGFDDIPAAAATDPPLTTVRQPLVEKGRAACRLILEGWPRGEPPTEILPTELVVRGSSGPVPP